MTESEWPACAPLRFTIHGSRPAHKLMNYWTKPLIVEQHINSIWRVHKGSEYDPSRNPSPKKILDDLLKAGKITSDEHRRLDRLRDIGETRFHLGNTAARKEASLFLAVAEEFTRNMLGIHTSAF